MSKVRRAVPSEGDVRIVVMTDEQEKASLHLAGGRPVQPESVRRLVLL